ncbi:pimeloyl-ACP methyl ester carboxylesterase, partial [Rhizobium leguminosarum]|nr:pimeloyl-ACP methyl ester carboxylesterase [Rhizobium leguminosarum]MBB4358921.1 pimeloyl-ACP methyl ester carboxylesterase [Rhizobium leguminosarum]MBB4390872.1 pimeloyl-ACP methyl ester carboxylesterase [Rhizobium leguminosarum]MBB4553420.1 pimeloyl-ACP methyl ester carboxylesterase [Rhizobium leguminosarum]MBB4591260.1 pimeloyl-ACP methyl ester carboxylesterase [Rhizobium leguminosarum]
NATFVTIPQAGHMPQMEAAAIVNNAIIKTIARA